MEKLKYPSGVVLKELGKILSHHSYENFADTSYSPNTRSFSLFSYITYHDHTFFDVPYKILHIGKI